MSDPRRASDDLLIQLIRENRHDAEIGVRLGISTGEVRERKNALRRRLGEERYREVIDAARTKRTRPWRRKWVIAAASALGLVALLLVAANILVGEPEEIAAVRVVPTATPRPTPRPPARVSVGDLRFDDAGAFLTRSETSGLRFVGSPDNRAALTVVDLEGTTFITPSEFAQWTLAGGGRGELRLRAASLGSRAVTLRLNVANSATRLRSIRTDVGPVAEVSSILDSVSPVLLIRAYSDSGRQLMTQVTVDGRLHVSQDPIPDSWVIEELTGRRLDTGDGEAVGAIATGGSTAMRTFCDTADEGMRCLVVFERSMGVELAADGVVTCTSPTTRRFESETVRLDFAAGYSITPTNETPCEPFALAAGTRFLGQGDWEIVATTPGGEPLSVGAARDGTIVVGTFSGDLACPCVTQP